MAEETEKVPVTSIVAPGGVQLAEPPGRESMRGIIAAGLLGLLALEIGATFLALAYHWVTFQEAKELFGLVTAPTVGLVGAVMGFYFSSRQ